MGQAQINVRTRACSGTFIARTKQAALTHNVRGKRLNSNYFTTVVPALGDPRRERPPAVYGHVINVPTHFNVPIRPSDEWPPAMCGHFSLVPRVSVHDRYYCILISKME